MQVIAWSALSYALHGAPSGVPRRVDIPDTWNDVGPWSVARVRSFSTPLQECQQGEQRAWITILRLLTELLKLLRFAHSSSVIRQTILFVWPRSRREAHTLSCIQ